MENVSVIIPVYNEESYIRQSMESVMSQTYKNLEIIVIDDGSTDKSIDICKELSQRDERIFIFSQKNAGVSAARNHGIDFATGEYIFFMDGDDAIHPFLIEYLVCQMKEYPVELAMCKCKKVANHQMENILNGTTDIVKSRCLTANPSKAEEWFHLTYPEELSSIGGKMLLRKFIGELRFDRKMIYGEDTLFLYHLICKGVSIVFFEMEWYFYRQHPNSTTHFESIKMDKRYFECTRIIRNKEYEKKQISFALYWEEWILKQMEKSFVLIKQNNKKKRCKDLRKIALVERKHPLFRKLKLRRRIQFQMCFFAYPLYKIQSQGIRNYFREQIKIYM